MCSDAIMLITTRAPVLSPGEIAAVKTMEAVLDKEEDIKAELNVFRNHAHHPNIVDFHGAFLKRNEFADDSIWLVMEVMLCEENQFSL